jgi:hypothetical protein
MRSSIGSAAIRGLVAAGRETRHGLESLLDLAPRIRRVQAWENDHVSGLPPAVQALFWEYGDRTISLDRDRELVIDRVLVEGDWESIRWLRSALGTDAVRVHLLRTRGRRLSPRQLRLWQVLLDLPVAEVDAWIQDGTRRIWDERAVIGTGVRWRKSLRERIVVSMDDSERRWATTPDPVVEAYKRDVDRTLLRENLKRSVEERLRDLVRFQRFSVEWRRAAERAFR